MAVEEVSGVSAGVSAPLMPPDMLASYLSLLVLAPSSVLGLDFWGPPRSSGCLWSAITAFPSHVLQR